LPNLLSNPLISSYIEYWRRAFEFRGRTTRSSYWWSVLAGVIVNVILAGPYYAQFFDLNFDPSTAEQPLALTLFGLANYLPTLTIYIRRLRDVGKSWKWMFIALIPIIGAIWILRLLIKPSIKNQPN